MALVAILILSLLAAFLLTGTGVSFDAGTAGLELALIIAGCVLGL